MKNYTLLFLFLGAINSLAQNNTTINIANKDTIYMCSNYESNLEYTKQCENCLFLKQSVFIDFGNGTYESELNVSNSYYGQFKINNYATDGIYKVKVKYVVQGNIPKEDSVYVNYIKNCPFQTVDIFEDINGNCIKDAGEVKPNNFNPNFSFYYFRDSQSTTPTNSNLFYYHPLSHKMSWLYTEDSFWFSSTQNSSCPIDYNLNIIPYPVIKYTNLKSQMDTLSIRAFIDQNNNCIKDATESFLTIVGVDLRDNSKSKILGYNLIDSKYPYIFVPKNSNSFTFFNLSHFDSNFNSIPSVLSSNCIVNLSKNTISLIPIKDTFYVKNNYWKDFNYNNIVNDSIPFKFSDEVSGIYNSAILNVTSSDGHNFNINPYNTPSSILFNSKGYKIIISNLIVNNSIVYTKIDTIRVVDKCTITGKAYLDSNENCQYDIGEYIFKDSTDNNTMNIYYRNHILYIGIFDNTNYGSYQTNIDTFGNYYIVIPQDSSRDFEIRMNYFGSNVIGNMYYLYSDYFACFNNKISSNQSFINRNIGFKNLPLINSFYTTIDSGLNCINDTFKGFINIYKSKGNCWTIMDWGDGSKDSIFHALLDEDISIPFSHKYANSGIRYYNFTLKSIKNEILTSISDSVLLGNCSNLSGNIYVDLNANCSFDSSSDLQLNNYKLVFKNSNNVLQKTAFSDIKGHYTVKIDSSIDNYLNIQDKGSCTSNNNPILIPKWNSILNIKNIGLNKDSIDYTPFINIRGIAFPGDTLYFDIGYNGIMSNPNTDFTISIPNKTHFVNSNALSTSFVNNNVNLNGYIPLVQNNSWSESIHVAIKVDTNLTISDTICFSIKLHKKLDEDTSNNLISICLPARLSHDPNDKNCFIKSMNSQGEFLDKKDELNYLIRFQNTGNSPARNIYILDNLDSKLDITTFKLLSSSHNVQVELNENRSLRFLFKNINLPDSCHFEPQSHGYITYNIRPLPTLNYNENINNQASIYFDYNEPIFTNITKNKYVLKYSTSLVQTKDYKIYIYPNPCDDYLNIQFENNDWKSIELYNLLGHKVYEKNNYSKNQNLHTIDIKEFKKGIYLLNVLDNKYHLITSKISINH